MTRQIKLLFVIIVSIAIALSSVAEARRESGGGTIANTFTRAKTLTGGYSVEFSMVTLSKYKKEIDEVFDYTFLELDKIAAIFDPTNPTSDVSRVNDAAGGPAVPVSKEMITLAKLAVKVSKWSKGAFDVVTGAGSYKHLKINEAASTIRLTKATSSLDFSSILPGFISDLCTRAAYHANVDDAFVRVNGVVRSMGKDADWPWSITISGKSDKLAKSGVTITIANFAAATVGGNYSAPSIDPRTKKFVNSPFYSVTVLTGQAATAEGVANAVYVLGENAGTDLTHELGIRAIFAYKDGRVVKIGKWK